MFLMRYSLKKQQPACLPDGGELAGMGGLGPRLPFSWKHRGNNPMKIHSPHAGESDVGCRCTKIEVTFWTHLRSECLNIELTTPVFLSSIFLCRGISF